MEYDQLEPLHIVIKGDVDRGQEFLLAARNFNSSNKKLFKGLEQYQLKLDVPGARITDSNVFGTRTVTIDVPIIPALEPSPWEETMMYPPAAMVIESFYIEFDVVEPDESNTVTWQGKHLRGYWIPPFKDAEFIAREGPTYTPIDCLTSPLFEPDRCLVPTREQPFTVECEPITNTEAFTLVSDIFKVKTYVYIVNTNGQMVVIAKDGTYYNSREIKINGNTFKTSYSVRRTATGVGHWGWDVYAYVGGNSARPAYAYGDYVEWKQATIYLPEDPSPGYAGGSVGDGPWATGAYDYETEAFICVWEWTEVTRIGSEGMNRFSWAVGTGSSADIEEVIVEEQEEDAGYSISIRDCKIYNTPIGQIFLLSYLIQRWQDYEDEIYWRAYHVIQKNIDRFGMPDYKQYYKLYYLGAAGTQAFYFHMMTDKYGGSWPIRGVFRLVKDQMAYIYQGDMITFNMGEMKTMWQEVYDKVNGLNKEGR